MLSDGQVSVVGGVQSSVLMEVDLRYPGYPVPAVYTVITKQFYFESLVPGDEPPKQAVAVGAPGKPPLPRVLPFPISSAVISTRSGNFLPRSLLFPAVSVSSAVSPSILRTSI